MRRILSLVALLMFFTGARAEHAYEITGKTAFLKTETVYSPAGGTISQFSAIVGEYLEAGETVGFLESMKVYAQADGTVCMVTAREGTHIAGNALLIEPKEKYTLLASGSYAYAKPENMLIHPGETVYASCVTDGTHLAIGYVSDVDGQEFTVYTTHGTLYVGEAVVLYRDRALNYASRVGRATVYASQPVAVQAEGTITKLYVKDGDKVEKGEILFEYIEDGGEQAAEKSLTVPKTGVITELYASEGERIGFSEALFELADAGNFGVIVNVSEKTAAKLKEGGSAKGVFLADDTEKEYALRVLSLSLETSQEDGTKLYGVRLVFDEMPPAFHEGMTVRVIF